MTRCVSRGVGSGELYVAVWGDVGDFAARSEEGGGEGGFERLAGLEGAGGAALDGGGEAGGGGAGVGLDAHDVGGAVPGVALGAAQLLPEPEAGEDVQGPGEGEAEAE